MLTSLWLATLPLAAIAGEATLLPPPPLHGDGETPAVLQVATNSPGAKVRVKASEGKILDITPVPGGVIVRYLPPAVTAPTPVEIAMRAKGEKADTIAKITVVPGFHGRIDVRPDVVLVDPGATTTVRFRPSGPTPQAADQRRLLVSTNLGTLGPVTVDPQGGWMATYTPPANLTAPARAIVIATDAAAPGEILGATVLALTATRDVTITAKPGSVNTLDVGGRLFGPVTASPAGTASLDVKLHPDHPVGTLTSKNPDGTTAVSDQPMPVAAPPAVAIQPLPPKIPGETPLPVIVFCRTPAGESCAPTEGAATATGGTVTAPVKSGDAWTVTWTAPVGPATLSVKVGDTTTTFTGTGVAGSANLELVATPPAVPSGKSDFTIEARAKTAGGAADPGRTLQLDARGATAAAKPKDRGDGSYTVAYKLDKASPYARVVAASIGAPTGLPARRMVAWPTQVSTPADGKSTAMVVIAVEDALGAPIPDVALTLAVPVGDATVPPTAKTGKDGLARVEVRSGTKAGPIVVTVTGGGVGASATLWQEGGGKTGQLVAIGPEDDLGAIRRWQDRVPAAFVGRSSAPTVAQRPKEPPPVMGGPPPVLGQPPPSAGPALSAGSDAQQPAKAPHVIGEPSRFRLHLAALDRPGTGKSVTGGADGVDFAPEATWAVSPLFGAIGLHGDVDAWLTRERKLGVDARVSAAALRYRLGDTAPLAVPFSAEVGVRWRIVDTGTVSVAPGLGGAWVQGQAIVYSDASRTRAIAKSVGISAARVGGVFRYERDALLLQIDLEGAFAPRPTLARAEASLDLPLKGALVLHTALGADARWFHVAAPEDADAWVNVRQISQEVRVGIGVVSF